MADKEYTVSRHHIGDKDYVPGDTRIADGHEVAHLVARGVLTAKVEAPLENKADAAKKAKA